VIPPSISNWKNIKGYTIPLDKRLATDGRGMIETQINDKFAKLSEALFITERTARKEIETRALLQKKVAQRVKEAQEDNLRGTDAPAKRKRVMRSAVVRSTRWYQRRAPGATAFNGRTDAVAGEWRRLTQ